MMEGLDLGQAISNLTRLAERPEAARGCRGWRVSLIISALLISVSPVHAEESTRSLYRDCVSYFFRPFFRNWNPFRQRVEVITSPRRTTDLSTTFDIALERWRAAALTPKPFTDDAFWIDVNGIKALHGWNLNPVQRSDLRDVLEAWRDEIRTNHPEANHRLSILDDVEASLPKMSNNTRPLEHPPKNDHIPDPSAEIRNRIILSTKKVLDEVAKVDRRPKRLFDDVQEILVGKTLDDDDNLAMANIGLQRYFFQELSSDATFAGDALEFYSRLKLLDSIESMQLPNPTFRGVTLTDPKSLVNVWEVALRSTEDDPARAIRVMGVYGHDDVANPFAAAQQKDVPHRAWASALEAYSPPMASVLFQNAAFDGLAISPKLRARFAEFQKEFRELEKKGWVLPEEEERVFRAGNYHLFGGAFLTSELMRKGHDGILGLRMPVFVAEVLGKIYKRITMEETYLTGLAKDLYRAGYPEKSVPRPPNVTDKEFGRAQFFVRLNLMHLELTAEQHRRGAEWAYAKLKQAAKASR